MRASDVAELLCRCGYRMGTEQLLQDDVEAALSDVHRIAYEREHRLAPGERVDFFVDGHIALELKIKAQRKSIYRQLERYASHDEVDSLILMTASAIGMPPAINGKPVYVVNLGRNAL